MKTHLFILGAGASLDFLNKSEFNPPPNFVDTDLHKWEPPLSNKIFDTTRFYDVLEKYPDATDLASYINTKLRKKDAWLESILTDIRDNKTTNNPLRKYQLVSMKFYLSELFREITLNYYKQTNHHKVLQEILRDNKIDSMFINFNYDLLLEKSISLNAKSTDDYLKGEFPVIKIHGAYNWYYQRKVNSFQGSNNNSYKLSIAGADYVLDNSKNNYQIKIKDVTEPSRLQSKQIDTTTAISHHPAIALPLNNKSHALCPTSHIDYLKEKLSGIKKVVIIGWRAADPHLLEILKDSLNDEAIIGVISGENAKDTVVPNLKKYLVNEISIVDSKYSDSLSSESLEKFILT